MNPNRISNRRCRIPALGVSIAALILVSLIRPAIAFAEEIWFAPTDHLPRNGVVYVSDFMDLLSEGAPWQHALARISVWQLSPRFAMAALNVELAKAISFMNGHHIQLAIGMAMVPVTGCGSSVEGMAVQGHPGEVAWRIKKLGGDLRYVGMDEPLRFGHQDKRPVACHLSTVEVAQRVAESVREVRAVFPEVKFIDEEPVSDIPGDDWLNELEQWLDAYQQSVGEPIGALQDDIDWSRGPWQERTLAIRDMLKKREIKYGVMFTAGGPQESDSAWIEKAKQNIIAYKHVNRTLPDQVYIASWNVNPSKVLPETEPTTLTYLVNWYIDNR